MTTPSLFLQILSALVQSNRDDAYFSSTAHRDAFERNPSFDFIIVGAGTAGCVVASRLSEHPSWRVLLVEAGGEPPILSDIPPLTVNNFGGNEYEWNYRAESSRTACRSSIDGQCILPAGRLVGGSGSLYGVTYARGSGDDYDKWASMGNQGWRYDNLIPYFKRLERVHIENADPQLHGFEGRIDVESSSPKTCPLLDANLKRAAFELGYSYVKDLASNVSVGVTDTWHTIKNGARSDTNEAYLKPAKSRSNLVVLKNTLVTRLLFDDNKVIGVEFSQRGGEPKVVWCDKEVIVSAGFAGSAKLLLLSGIGPREHLESHEIETLADLKVGYNMQDHFTYVGAFAAFNTTDKPNPWHMVDTYFKTKPLRLFGSGASTLAYSMLMTSDALATEANTVVYSNLGNRSSHLANVRYTFTAFLAGKESILCLLDKNGIDLEKIRYREKNDDNAADEYVIMVKPTLLKPASRGRVMLTSRNPFEPVKIVSGYLSRPEDAKLMIASLKHARLLLQHTIKRKVTEWMPPVEECQNMADSNEDDYYECYVRNLGVSGNARVGTCKMGPQTDPDAVVDDTLKVHGIEGVRVIDASIMPQVISADINVPVVMIGEKGADMIKQDWLETELIGSTDMEATSTTEVIDTTEVDSITEIISTIDFNRTEAITTTEIDNYTFSASY